jgi:hypothetical protein
MVANMGTVRTVQTEIPSRRIEFVSIAMVDDLPRRELSSELFLHHETMDPEALDRAILPHVDVRIAVPEEYRPSAKDGQAGTASNCRLNLAGQRMRLTHLAYRLQRFPAALLSIVLFAQPQGEMASPTFSERTNAKHRRDGKRHTRGVQG